MRRLAYIFVVLLAFAAAQSCEMVSTFIHDGEVVASVGRNKLYRHDLEGLIPAGLPAEDSLALAQQYINSWAADLVFLGTAQQKLSKSEKNLTKELEQYKNALLKYRYENLYINERLDTTVTDAQVEEYYENHKESLKLDYPIVKARFIRIIPGTISVDKVRKKIASDASEDLVDFDSIVYSCSDRYNDFGGAWVEITALAREFSIDYGTLISQMRNSFVEMEDSEGRICLAYISDYMRSGNVPPVEFCRDIIENVIISARKQTLLNDLERDLLEDARENGVFEIFE